MRKNIYSRVSAKTGVSTQHQSVSPDLKYWVVVKLSKVDSLITFVNLSEYTYAIDGLGSKLLDFGTFEHDDATD